MSVIGMLCQDPQTRPGFGSLIQVGPKIGDGHNRSRTIWRVRQNVAAARPGRFAHEHPERTRCGQNRG